jgi:hypothetical protein
MNRTVVSALLGLGIAFTLATAGAARADQCDNIEAKYRGNVGWCQQALDKCARGAEEKSARRGKSVDADKTAEGQACNRDYDTCMGKSAHNREAARAQAGCPN